jgi:L-ascorbate metabolism protein UlaG (beta-lactamase superfamily)
MEANTKKLFFFILILCLSVVTQIAAAKEPQMDQYTLGNKILKIYFLGHATLMLDYGGTIIHVDPVARYADYNTMPKADIILVTHQHSDHLDSNSISKISKPSTTLILNPASFAIVKSGISLANGKTWQSGDIRVEAVPAYNTTPGRDKYHPKGRDNGYILTLGQTRIYIAGDTENIPEMAGIKEITIAFLPMNQPYTMTPEQVAAAAKVIKPKILYPYHYGDTDVNRLKTLMAGNKDTELKIRELQ